MKNKITSVENEIFFNLWRLSTFGRRIMHPLCAAMENLYQSHAREVSLQKKNRLIFLLIIFAAHHRPRMALGEGSIDFSIQLQAQGFI